MMGLKLNLIGGILNRFYKKWEENKDVYKHIDKFGPSVNIMTD